MKKRQLKSVFYLAIGTIACLPFAINAVVAKEKVNIAFIGPLTGGNSHIGLGGRNSADLAIRLHNQNPSSKYEYNLVSLDDECKPNIGVQVVTKAGADRSIPAAIAHYCSAVAMATIGVFHKFGLPMITFTAIAPEITDSHHFKEINRVMGSAMDQNRIGPKFMREHGYNTWAVIHDTTAFGTSNDKYFTETLKKDGGKILVKFGVPPDQQDFTAELTKIKELNPQVVYVEGLAPLGIRVRLQMEKLGVNSQFDSVSGVWSDDFIKNLGPTAEGSLSRRIGKPLSDLPAGKEFLEKYAAAKYEQPADVWGHYAYAEANLLMDIIEKVGPDRKKIADALRKTKDHPTVVGSVTFNDHGQNINDTSEVVVVQDGKWVTWDKSEYASGKRKLKRTEK
jgi:branched-chain amino acid transport system substrate-binding protein